MLWFVCVHSCSYLWRYLILANDSRRAVLSAVLLYPFFTVFPWNTYKNRAGETLFCLSYLPSVIFRQELKKSLQQVPESSSKWFSMRVHMKPVAWCHHFLFTDYIQALLTCDPLMLAAHLFSVCYSTGLSSITIIASTLHAQHAHAHSTWPLPGLVLSFTAASSVFSWWEMCIPTEYPKSHTKMFS